MFPFVNQHNHWAPSLLTTTCSFPMREIFCFWAFELKTMIDFCHAKSVSLCFGFKTLRSEVTVLLLSMVARSWNNVCLNMKTCSYTLFLIYMWVRFNAAHIHKRGNKTNKLVTVQHQYFKQTSSTAGHEWIIDSSSFGSQSVVFCSWWIYVISTVIAHFRLAVLSTDCQLCSESLCSKFDRISRMKQKCEVAKW